MNRLSVQAFGLWLLKGNLIVWAINAIILAILGLFASSLSNIVYSGYFSKITLLETGIAFLIAGAMAFSGSVIPNKAREQIFKSSSEEWSMEKLRKSEKRANRYIILAVILFLEALIISFFGF